MSLSPGIKIKTNAEVVYDKEKVTGRQSGINALGTNKASIFTQQKQKIQEITDIEDVQDDDKWNYFSRQNYGTGAFGINGITGNSPSNYLKSQKQLDSKFLKLLDNILIIYRPDCNST